MSTNVIELNNYFENKGTRYIGIQTSPPGPVPSPFSPSRAFLLQDWLACCPTVSGRVSTGGEHREFTLSVWRTCLPHTVMKGLRITLGGIFLMKSTKNSLLLNRKRGINGPLPPGCLTMQPPSENTRTSEASKALRARLQGVASDHARALFRFWREAWLLKAMRTRAGWIAGRTDASPSASVLVGQEGMGYGRCVLPCCC